MSILQGTFDAVRVGDITKGGDLIAPTLGGVTAPTPTRLPYTD